MMKYRTVLIVLAVVATLFLIALIWAVGYRRRTALSNSQNSPTQQSYDHAVAEASTPELFPLRYGSGIASQDSIYGTSQPYVKRLQTALNKIYNASIAVDGKWGNDTQALVNRLKIDYPGTVGEHGISQNQLQAIESIALTANSGTAVSSGLADVWEGLKNRVKSWFS